MKKTIIVLDACAIIHLWKSKKNYALNTSLFSFTREKKHVQEQKIGDRLGKWLLHRIRNEGWIVCITKAAMKEAEIQIRYIVEEAARASKRKFATIRVQLLNADYINELYSHSKNCLRFRKQDIRLVKQSVVESFKRWKNPITVDCVTKGGKRKKEYEPENQDIRRLSEAIVNINGVKNNVVFVTADSHFICHLKTIMDEYGVKVVNYRLL